jgi:hypothetical protein
MDFGVPWFDLCDCWDSLVERGAAIYSDKDGGDTSRRVAAGDLPSNTYGLFGEKAYSLWSGLPMDLSIRRSGDDGDDFADGTDVKVVMVSNPNLLHPPGARKWPTRRFVLAYLDSVRRRAQLVGWASVQEMRRAPVKTFNAKMGPNHFLNYKDLHPMTEPMDKERVGPHDHRCPECGVVWPCKNLSVVCPCPVGFPCKQCRLAKMIGRPPPEPPEKKSQLDLLMAHIKDKEKK